MVMTIIKDSIEKCKHNIHCINTQTTLSVYFVGDYEEQKNLPLALTMTLTKTIQSFHHISFKHWYLYYPPEAPTWFLLFRFSTQNLCSLLHYMHATCHIMYYVNNICWTVTDMKLTTESSAPLYSYLPLTSNILLATLLLQTHSMCSFLDIRHQISHPHTRVSQMKILNIFYLVIYWTQKVHNDIFLRSLHCVPYKCSTASEIHGYI